MLKDGVFYWLGAINVVLFTSQILAGNLKLKFEIQKLKFKN